MVVFLAVTKHITFGGDDDTEEVVSSKFGGSCRCGAEWMVFGEIGLLLQLNR